MWFLNYHKSDSIFLPDTAEVFYVDGAYVTAVTLFLIACPFVAVGAMIFGIINWLCSHVVVLIVAHLLLLALMTWIQSRHSYKKFMPLYCAASFITFSAPLICSMLYVYPIIIVGAPIGAVFAVFIFYGGAFLCFSLSKLFKSGLSCLVTALIFCAVSAAVLYGFRYADAEHLAGISLSTFYSFWE